MRSTLSLPAGLAAMILLACNTGVYAHTWVEELRLIASNGSFVGIPGYIRNFGPRKPGVNIDAVNSHLLPANGGTNAFTSTDLLCKSNQLKGQQTPEYPALTAGPGDLVALRYLENGHVSKFSVNAGKPAGRGTVFIYGTKQSLDSDTYVGVHRVWNADGTGGDKRGKLIATRPYDDGRCAQVNNDSPIAVSRLKALDSEGTEVMCQNDFKIPTDAGTSGTYTLYWVWEWPTLDKNGAVATNESYTSCMDINMTPNTVSTVGKFADQKAIGQEANAVAIEAQMGDEQFLIDPTAFPVLTSDNLPAGATGVPAPKPKVGGGAADQTAAPVVTTSKAVQSTSTSAPAQGFKTVTVTAKEIETVYVTRDPSALTSSVSSKSAAKTTRTVLTSTITVRQPSATASSSAPPVYNTAFTSFTAVPMSSILATAAPSPSPFLTPYNQVQQAGARADVGAGADEAATSSSASCPTPPERRRRSRIESRSSKK
ncbi:hypothetical protein IFR04_007602 [Cadophora malorum]|uniref:DUF7492 domain-containing protein n=1 Tax=Cadophora malorum TaxID=108018 RepID=A0A8H7TI28_9HELO|nr:hypothetical protein IFR04_007602 [Cadophora malorum]